MVGIALQHLVQNPLGLQRLDRQRGMLGVAANMRIHAQHMVPLDMRVARHLQHFVDFPFKPQGLVVEHRKRDTTLRADQLDAIFTAVRDKFQQPMPSAPELKVQQAVTASSATYCPACRAVNPATSTMSPARYWNRSKPWLARSAK